MTLDMVHNLSGLKFLHTLHDGGLDDLEVLSCVGPYHCNWFPLSIWSHVHIMGWTSEIHSSLNFLSPSLNSKFWEGRVYSYFICTLVTIAPNPEPETQQKGNTFCGKN